MGTYARHDMHHMQQMERLLAITVAWSDPQMTLKFAIIPMSSCSSLWQWSK